MKVLLEKTRGAECILTFMEGSNDGQQSFDSDAAAQHLVDSMDQVADRTTADHCGSDRENTCG